MKYVVAALYHFTALKNHQALKEPLLAFCIQNDIKGTLLLAHEGINGTVAGTRTGIDALLGYLRNIPELASLEHKESFASRCPFLRMRVKLKNEIVTMGVPSTDPTNTVGTYVEPKDWNALIEDPEVLLIDTRNDYEVQIGHFKNSINPKTQTFREFPKYVQENLDPSKHQKIAMCCTGGIRCEKATSYLLEQGFKEVYHLKGGILKYLEEIPESESTWKGECFVFDNRVSIKHGLEEGDFDQCYGCRYPISHEEKESPQYKAGVHCPRCYNTRSADQHNRASQRQKQIELSKKWGRKHLGTPQ